MNFALLAAAAAAASFCLSGCVSSNETALANNVYQIEIGGRGLIGTQLARKQAATKAARLTIEKGYTHYLIQSAGTQQGSLYAGNTPVLANTTMNVYGNTAYANTTFSGGQPIIVPTSQTSLVVVMFRSPDVPSNAIDAAALIHANLNN